MKKVDPVKSSKCCVPISACLQIERLGLDEFIFESTYLWAKRPLHITLSDMTPNNACGPLIRFYQQFVPR